MGRPCTICTHPDRDKIDEALVAGQPFRGIARTYAVSEDAVGRHRAHVTAQMAEAAQREQAARAETLARHAAEREQRETVRVDDLLRQMNEQLTVLRGLQARMLRMVLAGEADGKVNFAAVREAREDGRAIREGIELLGRLIGQLQTGPTVNIVAFLGSSEWQVITTELRTATEPYPEASVAVAQALARLSQRLTSGQGGEAALVGATRG